MSEWQKKSRFDSLLSGKQVDRPIVSCWHHFLDKEQNADNLAEATISYTKKYNLDWVKINPRATYYAEVWGNEYDFKDYRWVFPKLTRAVIQKPTDVWSIQTKKSTESAPLLEQLQAVKQIRYGLPDTPLVQTIFSPLTVLLFLAGLSSYVSDTVYGSENPISLNALFKEQRAGVHHALHAIALTLADYVKELEHAGADGIFYAVTGTANPDLFNEAAFNEFSRPYDLIVLNAAKYGKRILHTCGAYSQPERFNDYPIEGISWDTKAAGNPGLDAELIPTKVGGIDHRLFGVNNLQEIRAQAKEALKMMEKEPFILVPNCAVPVNVQEEAIRELQATICEKR